MLWEIKTAEKKCVYQRTHFIVSEDSDVAAGKTFYMDEMYRWGRCVVRTNDKPTQAEDPYADPFELSNYEVDDQECDDGCSLDFEFDDDDNWTEEEKAYIEDLWERDGWMAFEEEGIYSVDCDTSYVGPLEIVCIDETVDEVAPLAKGTWPF